MSITRMWTGVSIVATAFVFAGCGSGTAATRPGAGQNAISGRSPSSPDSSIPTGFGRGAAFSPDSSLLYVSTTTDRPAGAALSRMRSRIPFDRSWSVGSSGNLLAELLSGRPFDTKAYPVTDDLTGYVSESLVSMHGVAGLRVGLLPDVVFYFGVANTRAVERWLRQSGRGVGDDGSFTLFHRVLPGIGYDAVSAHVWLFAYSLASLRRAIAVGAGRSPSLANDRAARVALAAVDSDGAALVGYSRGDLVRELTATHENVAESGDGSETTALTGGLGLSDSAFAIGANGTGFWINSAPHLRAGGFHPGALFTPTLIKNVPTNEILYVGIKDGARQWPQLDRAFGSYLGGASGARVNSGEGSGSGIESLISEYFRLRPTDVARLGGGEEAWFFGDTVGAAFRPSNLDEAIRSVAAMTRRSFPYSGVTSGHNSGVVWIHNTTLSHNVDLPGPSPASLVRRAHLAYPTSLIIAIDLAPLTQGLEDNAEPERGIDGVVVTVRVDDRRRYQLSAYVDVAR